LSESVAGSITFDGPPASDVWVAAAEVTAEEVEVVEDVESDVEVSFAFVVAAVAEEVEVVAEVDLVDDAAWDDADVEVSALFGFASLD
jgi:general stress protein 26